MQNILTANHKRSAPLIYQLCSRCLHSRFVLIVCFMLCVVSGVVCSCAVCDCDCVCVLCCLCIVLFVYCLCTVCCAVLFVLFLMLVACVRVVLQLVVLIIVIAHQLPLQKLNQLNHNENNKLLLLLQNPNQLK